MKRSKLTADPVKVAAFNQRGRGALKRKCGLAAPPVAAPRSLPGQRGWTRRVFALYGDRCVCCGGRAVQAHHVTPRQVILAARHLTRDERHQLAYDAANGCPVCLICHMAHEAAAKRIPYDRLPAGAISWAFRHGFATRVQDRRVYPRAAA